MDEKTIAIRLVEHGLKLFEAEKKPIPFTKNEDADRLLNNLTDHPHAFVLGCIMDRQIKSERAWIIPYRFKEKLGGFSMDLLNKLSQEDVRSIMLRPEPLHRYVEKMSSYFFNGIAHVRDCYRGNAADIWTHSPSSATVIYRFLEFEGVGPKIATMATNILAREFKVKLSDYYSVDISADVHVRRVFSRLGLTHANPTVDQVVFRARSLHPEFP